MTRGSPLRHKGDLVAYFYMLWGFVAAAVGASAGLAALAGRRRRKK